jgi:hypothetical protein
MRKYLIIAAVLALGTTAASTQDQIPPQTRPDNPAVNTTGTSGSGGNTLSEVDAKWLIEENGFSHVSELRKDQSVMWRGKATKDGKSVDVSLDSQGNVIAR